MISPELLQPFSFSPALAVSITRLGATLLLKGLEDGRVYRVLTMVYNTRDYWVLELRP
jgi:hypothetical protein